MAKTLEAVVRRRWLSPEEAVREVVAFERRFGEEHLSLACHCGLLLILTPELVNLVRINFLENIDWIAESNFLLSSLCRQLQEGIYEVEPCIREVLLVELENKFSWQRPFELAEFLWFYLDKCGSRKQDLEFKQVQQWVAKAYLDPDSTIRDFKGILDENLSGDNEVINLENQGEKIPHLIEILADPLEATNLWDEYQYLVNTSRVVTKLLVDDPSNITLIDSISYPTLTGLERMQAEETTEAREILSQKVSNYIWDEDPQNRLRPLTGLERMQAEETTEAREILSQKVLNYIWDEDLQNRLRPLTGLERMQAEETTEAREILLQKVSNYIWDEDPQNRLRQCYLKENPLCNAQVCLQLWLLSEKFKMSVNQELDSRIQNMRQHNPRMTQGKIQIQREQLRPEVEQYIIEREQIGARISEIETRFNLSNLPPLPEYDYQTIASIFGVKYRQIYELIGIPKTQVRRRSKALNILIKVLQDDNADFFNLLNT